MGLHRGWLCVHSGLCFSWETFCVRFREDGRLEKAGAIRIDRRYRHYASPLVANTENWWLFSILYSLTRYSLCTIRFLVLLVVGMRPRCRAVANANARCNPEVRGCQRAVKSSGCFARRQHKGIQPKQKGLPLTPTSSSVERASLLPHSFLLFSIHPFLFSTTAAVLLDPR